MIGRVFQSSRSDYTAPLLVLAIAVAIGFSIGAEKWFYGLGILAISLIFLYPVQFALGMFVFLIPFDSIAVMGPGKKGTTLTWFAGAAAALVLLGAGVVGRRLRQPPGTAIWWVLFVIWSAITAAWALDPQTSLQRLPTALAFLALYLASGCIRFTERELQPIIVLSIVGGCIAAIWTLYLFFQGSFWEASTQRASLMLGERGTNPNLLALSLLLPISLGFGYSLTRKHRFGKAVLLLSVAITILGLLVTMSRAAFLALLVIIFVYLYRLRMRLRIIVPFLLMALLLAFLPSSFFTRFQEAGKTHGAGRLDIWKAGLAALRHYPVFGAGFNNFPVAYTNYAGEAYEFQGFSRDAHNIYLAIAVETGVIGFLLFTGAIRSHLRMAARLRGQVSAHNLLVASEAACWSMLAFGIFGNILWEKTFWLSWMLLSMAVNATKNPRSGLERTA